jgi:hypothetical protein
MVALLLTAVMLCLCMLIALPSSVSCAGLPLLLSLLPAAIMVAVAGLLTALMLYPSQALTNASATPLLLLLLCHAVLSAFQRCLCSQC